LLRQQSYTCRSAGARPVIHVIYSNNQALKNKATPRGNV